MQTHIWCSETFFFFRKSLLLWDNVEKYCRAGLATDNKIIRYMSIARWIVRATNTLSQYVVVIALPL